MLVLVICSVVTTSAHALDDELSVRINPGGPRKFLAGRWAMAEATVSNPSDRQRTMLIVVSPPGTGGRQYARQITIPAKVMFQTQWPVKLVPGLEGNLDFQFQVYPDGNDDGIIRRRSGDTGLPTYNAIISDAGYGLTGVIHSADPEHIDPEQDLVNPDAPYDLLRTMTIAGRNSNMVVSISPSDLTGQPECLDVFDQIGISAADLSVHPEVLNSVRTWVQRGGHLMLFLDRTGIDLAEALIGDAARITSVGEASVNLLRLELDPSISHASSPQRVVERTFEEPVRYMRLVTTGMTPVWTVEGWTVAGKVRVGRGQIVISCISPQVFYEKDPNETTYPFRMISSSQELVDSMFRTDVGLRISGVDRDTLAEVQAAAEARVERELAAEARGETVESSGDEQKIQFSAGRWGMLEQQAASFVGYSIPSRWTAMLISVGFLIVLVVVGAILIRREAGEHLFWVLPSVAILVALPGIIVGLQSRNVAPRTVIRTELLHAVPGVNEVVSDGVAAIYNPDPSDLDVAATEGSVLLPDANPTFQDTHRLVWTGLSTSTWQNLSQPAGIQLIPLHQVRRVARPLTATATLDRDGIVGFLDASGVGGAQEPIFASSLPQQMSVDLTSDGQFRVASGNLLEKGIFNTGAMVSDDQVMRSKVMRHVLTPVVEGLPFPSVPSIFYWADPPDSLIQIGDADTVTRQSVLVVQPVAMIPPPLEEPVTIPPILLPYDVASSETGISGYTSTTKTWNSHRNAGTTRVAFAVPAFCQPFLADEGVIQLRIHAPARMVKILVGTGQDVTEVRSLQSPVGDHEIRLSADLLKGAAETGAVQFEVQVGDIANTEDSSLFGTATADQWFVEQLSLTLRGHRTTGR
ncbi:MAG: hypothetical protein KDA96_03545 [Planctomycetaceae bacterium]|nr:hypothetical protein [Planctomycetaceae bacterium]